MEVEDEVDDGGDNAGANGVVDVGGACAMAVGADAKVDVGGIWWFEPLLAVEVEDDEVDVDGAALNCKNALLAVGGCVGADLSYWDLPHERRMRDWPIWKPFIRSMAISADARATYWTNPQPLPGGILTYVTSPNGLKYCNNSSSLMGVDRPPTKTVVFDGSVGCWTSAGACIASW